MYRFFILFMFVFPSCKGKDNNVIIPKQVKQVPTNYVDAANMLFQLHQDTLYFDKTTFSGIAFQLFPSGDTFFVKPFLHGLEEGIIKKWYPNKQLAEERLYISGKKDGIHKGWWENGKPKFEFAVTNDEYTGDFKEWLSTGMLIKHFHYKNGQEEGSQKLFYENGKIKANYVIINGKRYGLLGTKNCKNVSDSIFTVM